MTGKLPSFSKKLLRRCLAYVCLYIYTIGRGARNISTKNLEIYYFKIKIIPFIIDFISNYAICYGQIQKT